MSREGRIPLNDEGFLSDAMSEAKHSKDPSTQVGCIIVRPDRSKASSGFNGFPRGVEDSTSRYEDRETKYALVVHAEANAIVTAREPLHGYTMYCTHSPCKECAKLIVQSGIKRVVANKPSEDLLSRWAKDFEWARIIFQEGGVTLTWY